MTEADREQQELITQRTRRIAEEHSDPAPVGPQYEALRALIAEELGVWLRSGEPVPDDVDMTQIAGLIAWEVEVAFPVGPQRTPEEWWQAIDEWRAGQESKP